MDAENVARTTLDDVAQRVGMSARTVSRVVNNEYGVAESTRKQVMEAIEELGYRPNLLARALITKRSGTVGLVGGDMTDPYFPSLAEAVHHQVSESGRTTFFACTGNDPARQDTVLRSLWSYAVDGVIVFPAPESLDQLRSYAQLGLRIVVVDDVVEAPGIACVRFDLESGARLGVRHLLDSGRRRVGMIASELSPVRRRRRERGFRAAFDEAGRDHAAIVRSPPTVQGGEAAAASLLDLDPELDAILAYNDVMAIGAVRAVEARGRRVPDDIAVVGFDDVELSAYMRPALTTIRLDRSLLSLEVTRALHNFIDAPGDRFDPVVLPVELVVRQSA